MKYLLIFFSLFLLTVHCNQVEHSRAALYKPAPHPQSLIDSNKYRQEIYRLDTLFMKLYRANQINGNVLIAKKGEVIYQKCFGFAIKENNLPLCDSSMFQLASVSKVFTAAAALILYEQGKLSLDEKVTDILAGLPYPDITVKQLLCHRSGLPNYTYFCSEYLKNDTAMLRNSDVLRVIDRHQPHLYFNSGRRFNYSNTNYALLALIIEKRSGLSYSQFLQQNIFTPLGMKHTAVRPLTTWPAAVLTRGYTASFRPVDTDRFDGVVGDKGIYASTHDLLLFSEALYRGKILKPETQQLAFAPYSPEKKLSNYGLGWRMKNMATPDKEVFHNGWWHGYRTSFHRRLRDSLTVIVLSNRLNGSVYATWRILQAIDGPGPGDKAELPDEE